MYGYWRTANLHTSHTCTCTWSQVWEVTCMVLHWKNRSGSAVSLAHTQWHTKTVPNPLNMAVCTVQGTYNHIKFSVVMWGVVSHTWMLTSVNVNMCIVLGMCLLCVWVTTHHTLYLYVLCVLISYTLTSENPEETVGGHAPIRAESSTSPPSPRTQSLRHRSSNAPLLEPVERLGAGGEYTGWDIHLHVYMFIVHVY